jgi:hypothetical protein
MSLARRALRCGLGKHDCRPERNAMPTAEAKIETEDASRYLLELCQHLNDKVAAHPEMQAHVEWSETHGTAHFGWGRCTMKANTDALILRAESDDQDGLEQVQEFVSRHLEKHGAGEQLTVSWHQDGAPAASAVDPSHRRERMREFHRRARP